MKPHLFQSLPRSRPNYKRMRVIDASHMEPGAQHVRFGCERCNAITDWEFVSSITEARRGLPCPNCNKDHLCKNQK